MSDLKSHRVGRATLANGVGTMAYRALVDIECAMCARVITPGAIFSRRTKRTRAQTMQMGTIEPVCAICRPVRLDAADDDSREGG